MASIDIRVQAEDFDIGVETQKVRAIDGDAGAIVTFSGICRDEGGRLGALELEHYPGMAETEIGRIAADAAVRWPLSAITIIHRYGRMMPGDNIVLVVTASAHRQAAFEAASFLMDFMKTRAPFWKKEVLSDKSQPSRWVSARHEDDHAERRWRR